MKTIRMNSLLFTAFVAALTLILSHTPAHADVVSECLGLVPDQCSQYKTAADYLNCINYWNNYCLSLVKPKKGGPSISITPRKGAMPVKKIIFNFPFTS